MTYAVLIEKGDTSYGASAPDLPGCIAVGETLEEVQRLIREAVAFHIEGLRGDLREEGMTGLTTHPRTTPWTCTPHATPDEENWPYVY